MELIVAEIGSNEDITNLYIGCTFQQNMLLPECVL